MAVDRKAQGKRNRAAGTRFELKVRKDLESANYVVSKWMNNVELSEDKEIGMIVPAKHKFCGPGRPMVIGTGFPDFIVYDLTVKLPQNIVYGVEAKSNGYLDKVERAKCRFLLDKNIFTRIVIAVKGEKRGEIIYKDFEEEYYA